VQVITERAATVHERASDSVVRSDNRL